MKRQKSKIFTKTEWAQLAEQLCLSPRQVQIIRLLCDGHKNYSAAYALGISPHTLRTYFRRLYSKLGVSNRFELLCLLFHTVHNGCPPKR